MFTGGRSPSEACDCTKQEHRPFKPRDQTSEVRWCWAGRWGAFWSWKWWSWWSWWWTSLILRLTYSTREAICEVLILGKKNVFLWFWWTITSACFNHWSHWGQILLIFGDHILIWKTMRLTVPWMPWTCPQRNGCHCVPEETSWNVGKVTFTYFQHAQSSVTLIPLMDHFTSQTCVATYL